MWRNAIECFVCMIFIQAAKLRLRFDLADLVWRSHTLSNGRGSDPEEVGSYRITKNFREFRGF